MKTTAIFFLFSLLCGSNLFAQAVDYDNNHIAWSDQNLHLTFMLDKRTLEASVGTGISNENKNALCYPPIGDPWWNDQKENFWDKVEIPSTVELNGVTYTVTTIACNAFAKSTLVHHVTLPNTIKSIDNSAFYMCTALCDITLNEGLVSIGSECFQACTRLGEVHLPSSLNSIGVSAFGDCTALASINIPGNCNSIGNDAFSMCSALEDLVIEDSDHPLNVGYAYDYGIIWKQGYQPYNYLRPTWRGAFSDCLLKKIYIGRDIVVTENNVDEYSPFEGISQSYGTNNQVITTRVTKFVDKLVFGDKVKTIRKNLFKKFAIEEIVLPKNVEVIEKNAFYESYNASELIIPATCVRIESCAFQAQNTGGTIRLIDCQSVTPPEVAKDAFNKCSGLMVKVPNGARDIYSKADFWGNYLLFDPDDELISVNLKYAGSLYGRLAYEDIETANVYRLKVSGTLGNDDMLTISSMPNLYEVDMSDAIAEDISSIGNVAKNLRVIVLPKGIKRIPQSMFANGHLTGELVIPETCTEIGFGAFKACDLRKVVITGPTFVNTQAFFLCANLAEVSIIGNGAVADKESFYYLANSNIENSGLKKLTIGAGVTINEKAFYYSRNLQEIIIEGKVKYIASQAFDYQDQLLTLRVNGSVERLDEFSFANSRKVTKIKNLYIDNIGDWCAMDFKAPESTPMANAERIFINDKDELVDLEVPNTVKMIGQYALYGCPLIRKITSIGSYRTIGKGAFQKCLNLTEVNLPQSVNSVEESAFADCTSLETFEFPTGCKQIYQSTFQNCSKLKNIELPLALRVIGAYSFAGCESLEEVVFPNGLSSIYDHAFEGCSSITKVELPTSLTYLQEMAFAGCSNLKRIEAIWTDPITINTNVFNNINSKCVLLVPVGTVPDYYAKGWGRVPIIDEGFCLLNNKISGEASLSINGKIYVSGDCAKVEIDTDVEVFVVVEGYNCVKELYVNGNDVLYKLKDNKISFNDINENMDIEIVIGESDIATEIENSHFSVKENDRKYLQDGHIIIHRQNKNYSINGIVLP